MIGFEKMVDLLVKSAFIYRFDLNRLIFCWLVGFERLPALQVDFGSADSASPLELKKNSKKVLMH